MASGKGAKPRDDKTKKRKRDGNEHDPKSKRHRSERRERNANGNAEPVNRDSEHGKAIRGRLADLTSFEKDDGAGWRISKPMGGRMLDVDPILTADEQYLILTYNTSIQIYSAADSLLIRRIPISTLEASLTQASKPATIVTTRLSKSDSDFVWVACSDGSLYYVNWTKSSDSIESFKTNAGTPQSLVVIQAEVSKTPVDIVLVTESVKSDRTTLMAYSGLSKSKVASKSLLNLKRQGSGLQLLEASEDGRYLVGAINDCIFVGSLASSKLEKLDQLQYEIFSFDMPELASSLDLRAYPRPMRGGQKGAKAPGDVVDIIVGSARGAIYRYHDAVARLQSMGKHGEKDTIEAQKYHWHRKAVHAVKWSRDGNYMISGGSENTLVMWQMDTSKKNFLPHLSGAIENIVVSSAGSSYVVHLDDNSTMILSTAELAPTAYVSGIQSAVVQPSISKDSLVQRVWSTPDSVRTPIPAAIRPSEPSKLHICVGNGQQTSTTGTFSAPMLQSFNLETFANISKQALARTQPTNVNITNKGVPIDEPIVSQIAFSADGKWLASVDHWSPAARDVECVSTDARDRFIRERGEVYLKFWEVHDETGEVALASRINNPHVTDYPELILDLASSPDDNGFATIGADGAVRIWRSKQRLQNGIVVKGADGQPLVSWSCTQAISVDYGRGQDGIMDLSASAAPPRPQGRVTFSEDGSIIFAAFATLDTGVVYVIDAASGVIAKTLEGLWSGELHAIQAAGSFLVILSDQLVVYDIVGDELRYGINTPKAPKTAQLAQLAVDYTSGHFAVSLPVGQFSSVGVFDPEEPEPLMVRSVPHRIVSLVPSPDSSGFIAVDDVAQVWVISEGSDPSSLASAQPLSDLRLDTVSADAEDVSIAVVDGEGDEEMLSDVEDVGAEDEDVEMEDDDDDDVHVKVIPQQHLTDIFDAAPAFAAPSVEDMFYKVTGLLAMKPLVPSA